MDDSILTLALGPNGTRALTTRAVERDAVLLVLEGSRVPEPERHSLQIGEALHLVSPDAPWRYLDHACEPNAWIELDATADVAGVRLRALVPLEAGVAVTFNYLTTEWELATPFPCGCGAASCAGWIRGARHLDAARLAALRPTLAPHVRARLRAEGRLG
ncbi:hypothetical protein [Archangium primigenium]|uniref:hypothetical protein n=1 Tax=[Archangium] primigenium TaxID=2792470 RepID=UPI00195BABFD|nr:hypothetical protein [Archangium primigenium]MBM7114005.1 hypothetical protein [Archangium primigenium]